jgi:hypothetical protein
MKVTAHFLRSRLKDDRKWIDMAWIDHVIADPVAEEVQADGRIRRWGTVPELNGRYLRVVLLPDGETVMTAFLDRKFRP